VRAARGLLIVLLLLAGVPAADALARTTGTGSCGNRTTSAGDWPSLNHDLANSRNQPDETSVGVPEAADLRPAWSFSGKTVGATGGMRSTPIVAGGCVYLGLGEGYLGDRGDVIALDEQTGAVVWHTTFDGSVLGLAAADGLIYATPSSGTRGDVALPVVTDAYAPAGSHAVALDARTGEVRWRSERLDDGNADNGTFVNASPVVFEAGGRRMVFVPLAGGAGDGARIPMWFLDARTGATIAKAYSLTDAEYQAGFGGTGMWSTAAYDAATQHLYVGTSDSDGRTRQHPYNNAILRIDANPQRPTFAKVVGAYSGTTEHANLDSLIGYPHNPLCGALAAEQDLDLPTFFDTSASVECLELDFDFGASPNLFRAADGRLRVSALQKSGVLHAVDAERMQAVWTAFLGPGGAFMDAGTPSVADGRIHVGATPNLVLGFDQEAGDVEWLASTGSDLFAYQPVSTANGVLYTINDAGHLLAFDAATGRQLLDRLIAADGRYEHCLGVGAGVAVSRGTVLVPCDAGGLADLAALPAPPGGLIAYRVP
jgi:outer membrane protein assembly factor BamB